jgi:BolA family transcriptional regulator, general stress-responsive regulator
MQEMTIEAEIYELLMAEFTPELLVVENESHHHAGHAEAGEGGDTHFRVRIKADCLQGKSRVAQHQAIYVALAKLINNPIHALAIEIDK